MGIIASFIAFLLGIPFAAFTMFVMLRVQSSVTENVLIDRNDTEAKKIYRSKKAFYFWPIFFIGLGFYWYFTGKLLTRIFREDPNFIMLSFGVFTFTIFSLIYFFDYPEAPLPKQKPQSRITKALTAEGWGTLLSALKSTFERGTPLVAYVDTLDQSKTYSQDQQNWSENMETVRVTNEDRGIVLGAPGSGKTTYLLSQLIDWMQSGQSFVCTDIKPEIWAILRENGVFERYGYTDWVFNPTDVNSHHYNLFSEAKDSSELNEILNIIIPDAQSDDSNVFSDNARRLLKAVLIELGEKASLPQAQKFINASDTNEELLKKLRQSENDTVSAIAREISRTAKNENLLASIMTSVSKAFVFLDDDRIRQTLSDNSAGFELKQVLKRSKQAVFLQFDQKYKNSTSALFGAMVAHILRILQENYRNRSAVFVALDEIINCAPIPKFIDSLNTMRSANMPTFLYLQALEGLNRLYGDNSDELFLGASNLKVVFKIGDIKTAEHFSKLIGMTETTYKSDSSGYSYGSTQTGMEDVFGRRQTVSSSANSSNVSYTSKLEYIIEPEKFTSLEPHTAVITYNGTFGTLVMPKYWSNFDMPNKPKYGTVSEFNESKLSIAG